MYVDIRLHVARSYTAYPASLFSLITSLLLSNHLLLCLPIFLLPYSSIPISLLPTLSSSLLTACPYHFNNLLRFPLLSCPPDSFISYPIRFVTLQIYRIIRISVTSDLFSCAFFIAHVAAPYSSASLIRSEGVENVKTSCSIVKCVITFVANHFTPPRLSGPAHMVPRCTTRVGIKIFVSYHKATISISCSHHFSR